MYERQQTPQAAQALDMLVSGPEEVAVGEEVGLGHSGVPTGHDVVVLEGFLLASSHQARLFGKVDVSQAPDAAGAAGVVADADDALD